MNKHDKRLDGAPFRFLGYDDGMFFYLPDGVGQIVPLMAGSHRDLQLLAMAPLYWWTERFEKENKDGTVTCNWKAAADAVIQESKLAGVYNPSKIRGRGAWIDDGRVILHLGDQIIFNGETISIDDWETKFIYQIGQTLAWENVKPLPQGDDDGMPGSAQLLRLCEMLPWRHAMSAKLFAGWCALAPICGVLSWRPHIWVSGPAGSGKSYTLTNVVEPLLGSTMLAVQSATTEAGIRQKLKSDALPVMFDEAESEDQRSQSRIQGILELARQASSENGAGIIKGTTSGVSMEFKIRSMFCFASIGVATVNEADKSRCTVLEFYKRNDVAAFDALKQLWAVTIGTDGFTAGIRARSLSLALTIKANAASFTKACALRLGDQRAGDQIGTLLAGAFSLTSTRTVTLEEATKIIADYDWTMFEKATSDADEWKCWNRLIDAQVRVKDVNGVDSYSIGELISVARQSSIDETSLNARGVLMRTGINITAKGIYIACSSTHAELAKIFNGTAFSGKWKEYLQRLPDAKYISSWKFIASHRAVRVPLSILDSTPRNIEQD